MEIKRKPFQGVCNIIQFNWHFYVIAFVVILIFILTKDWFSQNVQYLLSAGIFSAVLVIIVSLIVSFYIYDVSDFYRLDWLIDCDNETILSISAGFDETSDIVKVKFNNIDLTSCDFYDPKKHTEVSISRARATYPPSPELVSVKTDHLPFLNNTFDKVVTILAAHEIRNEKERVVFFEEINRVTKLSGEILVTEHLRDWTNFLAYNVGFLHFYSKTSWLDTFRQANLIVRNEIKLTPFITTFILEKGENSI